MELISNLQKPLPLDVALLIKESFFCGYQAGQVLTCCPSTSAPRNFSMAALAEPGFCSLQEGGAASCVAYNKCSPFIRMIDNLIKPLTKAVPFIMQEVYLCGVDTELGLNIPRICCPDQALAVAEINITEEE